MNRNRYPLRRQNSASGTTSCSLTPRMTTAFTFTGRRPAGYHTFDWDGTDERGTSVASGIYFARFVSGQTQLTRKMVLLK